MMIVGKTRVKNHMTLEYDFAGIRIIEGSLIPVDWRISVDIVAIEKRGKTLQDTQNSATMTYQRLFFWLDTNLPNILMVDAGNEEDLFIANLSSNIMLYCPGAPYDDIIAQVLHSKLTALANGNLLIGEIHVKGSDVSIKYSFDCPDKLYDLPLLTADYYTEGTARDVSPWWTRNDGFSFEFMRPDDTLLSDEELYKDIIDPMVEFERYMADMMSEGTDITHINEPARIVQPEKWKPKKV